MTAICFIWPPQGLGDEAPFADVRQVDGVNSVLVGKEEMAGEQRRSRFDGDIKGGLNDRLPRAVERAV